MEGRALKLKLNLAKLFRKRATFHTLPMRTNYETVGINL